MRGRQLGSRVSFSPSKFPTRSNPPLFANLDARSCEKQNKWLDEAPYYIDTSCVPRGGARRRKSMEPKALANLNGMLVSSPVKSGSTRDAVPSTPMNRRDSVAWMRTPPEQLTFEDGGDDPDADEWEGGLLTPVPATPAPEAIARFAANIVPETPGGSAGDDTTMNFSREELMTRTCPPKPNAYAQLGEGILAREKDEKVLQRLMVARRKSLQYAPRVGSPLATTWSG